MSDERKLIPIKLSEIIPAILAKRLSELDKPKIATGTRENRQKDNPDAPKGEWEKWRPKL